MSLIAPEVTDTRDKIKSWLAQEGILKEEIESDKLYFQISAEYPRSSGRHLSVVQTRDHEDMIVVTSRIVLADVHQKDFSSLPLDARERLIWRMRYDLLFQESSFQMEPGGSDLKSIRFTREIYYDGLTKNKLMEALKENFKCELYVVWKIQETFGNSSAGRMPEPPEPMYI